MTHGGRIWEAQRKTGLPYHEILDFSANMNPFGPPHSVVQAIQAALAEIRHYPDPDNHELVEALCSFHGIAPESLVVTNGGAEAISLLPPALGITRGICCSPTFSEYASALRAWGKEVMFVPASFEPGPSRFERAIEKSVKQASPGCAVFICNPNNPTGEYASRDLLLWAHKQLSSIGGVVVVDESFVDFLGEMSESISLVELAQVLHNLVVVRSMTKFFSIPGLRLGYAVMEPALSSALRRKVPIWSVNRLAQVAGVAAIRDAGFRKTALAVARLREDFSRALLETGVVLPHPSSVNFILVQVKAPGWDALRLSSVLKESGILVRDCSDFPGMGTHFIRVATRAPDENARLVRALVRVISV